MSSRLLFLPALLLLFTFAACDDASSSAPAGTAGSSNDPEQPDPAEADLRILFIGNSHTSYHRLPFRIRGMLQKSDAYEKVYVDQAIGGFLATHAESPRTLGKLKNGNWDIVVLQAQKYSQSGRYTYPHDGAIKLIELARAQGARVLMYPEWGQKGRDGEGERIHALHEQIASETGAEVVPVGRAWDLALERNPDLPLHASDGNHAAPAGAYLTACVFTCWLMEADLSKVGTTGAPGDVDADTRNLLKQAAWETVERHLKKQGS